MMITQSLALYEVWSLCGAQICSSKFFLSSSSQKHKKRIIDAHLQRMLGGD
jgi:hypothetical protein